MIHYTLVMTKTEIKPITVQILDLQENETVASATATHTPPSGTPLTITPTVDTPYVNILFGPFAVNGRHTVKVQATGNAASPSKPEVVYDIIVRDV